MANAWDVISSEFPRWWKDTAGSKFERDAPQSVMASMLRRPERETVRDVTPMNVLEGAADVAMPLAFYAGDVEAAAGAKALKGKGKGVGAITKALRGGDVVKPQGFALSPESLPMLEGVTKRELPAVIPKGEEDITRSISADPRLKGGGTIPSSEVVNALRNRERYRAEPPTLPKPAAEMTPQEWEAWGASHGADFRQNPMQSLGISDIKTKKELMLPGGLEGKFTIPDLFNIKANNFDPTALGQENHNALMKKFLRTYERPGGSDTTDIFNDLNFSLLSPNAPLTQNQFLAQRFRARGPEDLERLAARTGEENVGRNIDVETGTGAAARGGFGVKGTADLSNQVELARLLREKPEMFYPGEGETLRDVGFRVMNQVPGLQVKTASLGVPWTDLSKANTSAVDLHIIRNNYPAMMRDDPAFAERVNGLARLRQEANPNMPWEKAQEEAAIKIISQHPEAVYRMKGGELHPDLPAYLSPEKLAFEPEKFVTPSAPYLEAMRRVDVGRGANPEIELFPEQWRKWDTIRGRVEPHEQAHPDYRKLPKMSFSELQDAYQAHKDMGYTTKAGIDPTEVQGDWRRLYYGKADPRLLAGAGAGAAATIAGLRNYQGE